MKINRKQKQTPCLLLTGKYGEASVAGYTQSPGGFGSPAASQGGDKKGVSLLQLYIESLLTCPAQILPQYGDKRKSIIILF